MLPVISENLKNWLGLVTLAAVSVDAVVALIDLRAARIQRAQDLRWKQAEAGKKLNDELLRGLKVP